MIEIRAGGSRDFILCLSYDGGSATITETGLHVGVRISGIVVDNLHPDGMPYDEWLNDFMAVGGIQLTRITPF